MKLRILSGMRATGRLHLGNYLGAAKGFLELQEKPEYENFYMVADLHTLTTPYDKDLLRGQVRDVILDYLAVGLDPEKSVLFVQSMVPEHIELAYLFSTVTTVAKMMHLPTYKEKVKQYPENASMALLNYPVLMAADILVYKAGLVPVGIDQEPHLEVTREIARRMNQDFGTDFPEPKRFATKGEYVPSLSGDGKMSKSVEGSYISLTDNLELITKKLAGAPTDSGKGEIKSQTSNPKFQGKQYISNGIESVGVGALMQMVELFEGETARKEYEQQYEGEGIRYGELKRRLAEAIYMELKPIQEKRADLECRPDKLEEIIETGAEKAGKVARETVKDVKEKMGLI